MPRRELPIEKVLVIDDEPMMCWSIEQTLSAAGCEVSVAETAAEGMALFSQLAPEVVFLDLRLPDEDGLNVLRKMKNDEGRDAAVIVMTAFGEVRTAVEAMRLGAYDYLKKPFDFDELEAIVAQALKTKPLRREIDGQRAELGKQILEQKRGQVWEGWIRARRASSKIDVPGQITPLPVRY